MKWYNILYDKKKKNEMIEDITNIDSWTLIALKTHLSNGLMAWNINILINFNWTFKWHNYTNYEKHIQIIGKVFTDNMMDTLQQQ